MQKIVFTWEAIDSETSRVKVIGGWMIRSRTNKTEAIMFLADRDHQWLAIQPPKDEQLPKSKLAADFESPKQKS